MADYPATCLHPFPSHFLCLDVGRGGGVGFAPQASPLPLTSYANNVSTLDTDNTSSKSSADYQFLVQASKVSVEIERDILGIRNIVNAFRGHRCRCHYIFF